MSPRAFVTASLAWCNRASLRAADRLVDAGERVVAFIGRRIPETVIVLVALALRFSMLATYDPHHGYDSFHHLIYIQWFAHHLTLPDLMLCRETYHPPLYYFLEGGFSRLVRGDEAVFGLPSMMFASATLLLTWLGMERYLSGRRLARVAALALAAVLPAAVQLSAMMSAEAMNGLLATAALLLAADALLRQRRGQSILWRAVAIGVLLGLQMLTKISALVTLGAIGAGALFTVAFGGGDLAARARRATPWLIVVAAFGATCGWYFWRNQRLYGKAVLSGFDGVDGRETQKIDTPYLQRRAPDFFYGWSNDALTLPYAPSGQIPRSHFWPVVIATTFVDYYNVNFVRHPTKPSTATGNYQPLPDAAVPFSEMSAVGGVVIAVSTLVAWLCASIVSLKRRQWAYLVLLLAPAFALLGQLHFVVLYPYDYQGPIKGVYLQFACAPLYALFGLAVYTMFRRRATWPIGIIQCAAVAAVASYTIYARVFAF